MGAASSEQEFAREALMILVTTCCVAGRNSERAAMSRIGSCATSVVLTSKEFRWSLRVSIFWIKNVLNQLARSCMGQVIRRQGGTLPVLHKFIHESPVSSDLNHN